MRGIWGERRPRLSLTSPDTFVIRPTLFLFHCSYYLEPFKTGYNYIEANSKKILGELTLGA